MDPSLPLRISEDSLTAELARVVQETMQPQQVSVWLSPAAGAQQALVMPPDGKYGE
jgi:hypothetical protein